MTALWLSGCATAPPPAAICAADGSAWRLLGEIRWDHAMQFGGTTVGGLSAIDYDAAHDQYYLLSDDRSARDPARLYTARIRYDAAGLHGFALTGVQPLRSPLAQPYAGTRAAQPQVAVPDPEALRLLPGGDRLLWSSEGDFARGFGPELNEMRADGHWLRSWTLPAQLQLPQPRVRGQGPRNNFTFEGIAVDDDRRTVWVSMEAPLQQDGPLPRHGQPGGPVRLTAFDAASGQALRQIAYQPDALPADAPPLLPQAAVNGVSEILDDGPGQLLVLERSYVLGHGFGARLYRISTRIAGDAASDTLALAQLAPGNHRVAAKTLVLDFAALGLRSVDNLEGMAWGPRLAGGERVLLVLSDDNFNPAEVTQLVALAEAGRCGTP
ncbi:MAG: esterase-like activity of phytase family protein [Comamonas sp.]